MFYLVITVPSIIIGYALGLFSIYLSPRFSRLVFLSIFILICLIPIIEIYFDPQIYFFSPLIGFFPGTIYDEGLSVNTNLLIYRLINLLYFSIIIWVIYKSKVLKLKKVIIVFLLIALPVGWFVLSPFAGYRTTLTVLQSELDRKIISDNFITYFPSGMDTKLVKNIILHQEFYFKEIYNQLSLKPKDKTVSFVFSNNEQKKRLFGSGNADVAKPWLNQIYVQAGNYDRTLRHEIAHCFSGAFGTGLFKLASGFNPMLIEGFAESRDPFYDGHSIDFLLYQAMKAGYLNNPYEIFNFSGFFNRPSSVSYIFSGAFSRYLIENYTFEKFQKFYTTGEFNNIYGLQLNNVIDNFKKELFSRNYTYNKSIADYYFGRKPIFTKTCPRFISDRLVEAWQLFEKKSYLGAQKIFKQILSKSNDYSAITGLIEIYKKQKKYSDGITLAESYITSFEETPYYWNLSLILADLKYLSGKVDKADSIYNHISESKPNRDLTFAANIRISAISKNHSLQSYLLGSDFDRFQFLKNLNSGGYIYFTFPMMISFSEFLKENYDNFLKNFNMQIKVSNYESCYAVYSLSKYMLKNFDFIRARKFAALALRYDEDNDLKLLLKDNFALSDWLLKNGDRILKNIDSQLSN
ncbi:MAG: tetratricopeptide repeat protein [Ignavibacteriaceae bacterium]|nr:tetratricopeptide repeat protein [Ignavibacteriaceae bacterium]